MIKFYFILDLFMNIEILLVSAVIISPCLLHIKSKKARNTTTSVISSLFFEENIYTQTEMNCEK